MRILIVDDRVPDPHFGAGFPRAYRMLLSLIQLGHTIVFLPTVKHTIKELNLDSLKNFGVEVIDDVTKLKDMTIDLAILSRPHNVHYFLPEVKKYQPNAKTIYDTEALWYRRYDLQLLITGRLPGWAYRYDEIGMARSVDLCYVVNQTEKTILEENGVKKVVVLGHALEPHVAGKSFEDRQNVLVVGGILEEDSSNEDALWWYLDNAWLGVQEQLPVVLNVTGKATAPRLVKHQFPNVNLMGHVADLVPLYESQRIFVASTRFATGIPWKVHEAMAHGIPCVISRLLANQLGVTDRVEAMVCDTPLDFINKTVELYQNQELWVTVRENAFKLIDKDCNINNFKEIMKSSFDLL